MFENLNVLINLITFRFLTNQFTLPYLFQYFLPLFIYMA